MEIVRASDPVGWTTVPNDTIRDARVSFRARGLLAYLLSLPPGWRTSLRDIAKREAPEGYDALQVAMRELETAGYVHRERYQDQRGRWNTRVYVHATRQAKAAQASLIAAVEAAAPHPVDNPGRTADTEDGKSVLGSTSGYVAKPQVGPRTGTPNLGGPVAIRKKEKKTTSSLEAWAPASAAKAQEEEENQRTDTDAAAVRVFDALGPHWQLGPARRAKLTGFLVAAINAGWPHDQLVEHLGRNPEGVRDPYAVLRHRLLDLPSPPARKPAKPQWCGQCDETTRLRQAFAEDDRELPPARCADCHPLRATTKGWQSLG